MKKFIIGLSVLFCSFVISEIAVSISPFNAGDSKTDIPEKLIFTPANVSPHESAPSLRLPSVSRDSGVRDEIPYIDAASQVADKKLYSNYEYAYKVRIPSGLVALSSPPPLPQHGFGIIMSQSPKAYLWVDGSYNALMLKSLDADLDQEIQWLEEEGATDIDVIRREKTYLDKLSAVRLTVKYRSPAAEENRVQDLVVAFRTNKFDETEIVYTIGLIASESRYTKDSANFERLVKGWRTTNFPR
jgi:hypothetical protein